MKTTYRDKTTNIYAVRIFSDGMAQVSTRHSSEHLANNKSYNSPFDATVAIEEADSILQWAEESGIVERTIPVAGVYTEYRFAHNTYGNGEQAGIYKAMNSSAVDNWNRQNTSRRAHSPITGRFKSQR